MQIQNVCTKSTRSLDTFENVSFVSNCSRSRCLITSEHLPVH